MFTIVVDGRPIQTLGDGKRAMEIYRNFKRKGYKVDVIVANSPEIQKTHIGRMGAAVI